MSDATMNEKDTRDLVEEIAGSSAARRVLTAMGKSDPILKKFVRTQVRSILKSLKSFGAPRSAPQVLEDMTNLLVARLYEGLERGRNRLWEDRES